MCTYNSVSTMEKTLKGLLNAAVETDLRLIVSDNGSTDDTLDIIRDRAGALDITILENRANLGYAKAVNRALELRRPTATVLVLNPDVVIPRPSEMLDLIHQLGGSTAVVSPLLVKGDGSNDHACARPEPTPFQTLVYFLHLTPLAAAIMPDKHWYGCIPARAGDVASVSGAFMLIDPDALSAVGGLDERYWMYGEDLDWCKTFRECGYRIYFDPELSAIHDKSASTGGAWNDKTLTSFFDSMEIYYRKWYGSSFSGWLGLMLVIPSRRLWRSWVASRDKKTTRLW